MILLATMGSGRADAGLGDFVPGELVVRFAPGVDASEAQTIAADAGASALLPRYAPRHWLAETSLDPDDMQAVLQELLLNPDVEMVSFNHLGDGGYVPADTLFASQWHLEQDSDADINATAAWDLTRGSAEVLVAVLDSGILYDQPEFGGRVATNPLEASNGLDDDGNGLVDDIQGWDFVGVSGIDDNDPTDEHGHGTWVTSALAANADDHGVAGVDHAARILPLRVLDSANRGTVADLIDAIYYAADAGADIINMSLVNYPASSMLGDALSAAAATGSILVACAGNGGDGTADTQYPGAHASTLSVGSTDRSDGLAWFSSTGSTVTFSAPGDSILVADHIPPYEEDEGSVQAGCSLATPITAGVVSLMIALQPGLTQAEIEMLLAESALDLGPAGWDPGYGWGRIDAMSALRGTVTLFASGFE